MAGFWLSVATMSGQAATIRSRVELTGRDGGWRGRPRRGTARVRAVPARSAAGGSRGVAASVRRRRLGRRRGCRRLRRGVRARRRGAPAPPGPPARGRRLGRRRSLAAPSGATRAGRTVDATGAGVGDRRGRRPGRRRGRARAEAQATDAGPVRVDRRPGAGRRPPALPRCPVTGRRPPPRAGADGVDDLIEQRPGVAATFLEPVQQRDARRDIAGEQGVEEAVDGGRIGQAEQLADVGLVTSSVVVESSWSRIDSASRMPPAASRAIRWTAAGSTRRPSASRIRPSLPSISGIVSRRTSIALEARQDGGREPRRLGRGEHEDDEVGRFLERLEEGVPGVLRDLVGLVEDVDLAPQVAGGIGQPVAQVADLVDPAVRRGVDLEDVERRALADRRRRPRRRRTDRRPGGSCS